jgi:hypothetical protein
MNMYQIFERAAEAEKQGQGKSVEIIGQEVGKIVTRLLTENPKAGMKLLEVLETFLERIR